jgi:hypothetical protein
LLGIGDAGGKSGKSEGAMLASRLETLRKERAERSPEIKTKREPIALGAGSPLPSSKLPPSIPRKTGKRQNNRKKDKR